MTRVPSLRFELLSHFRNLMYYLSAALQTPSTQGSRNHQKRAYLTPSQYVGTASVATCHSLLLYTRQYRAPLSVALSWNRSWKPISPTPNSFAQQVVHDFCHDFPCPSPQISRLRNSRNLIHLQFLTLIGYPHFLVYFKGQPA